MNLIDLIRLQGVFNAEIYDRHGKFARFWPTFNTVAIPGLSDILATAFASGPQRLWYFGLIDNASFSAITNADTMGVHAWLESTAYAEATRPQWSPNVASAVASNTTVATFTANANVTVRGLFISSSNTKGGSTGILWCAGAQTAQALEAGQVLRATYTLRGA
jgi:roadblock/LC7 domain-containing protein